MIIIHAEVPQFACPFCGRMQDAITALPGSGKALPADGDVAICWGCGEPAIVTVTSVGYVMRKPNEAEAAELQAEAGELLAMVKAASRAAHGEGLS